MAEARTVTMNKPGWLDLSSADAAASRDFYSKLFGWSADVIPDPEAGGYGFFKLDGKEVGGVGSVQDPQQPTAWTIYVLVVDADETARSAREAGGTVLMEPADVMGTGRMAIIADPTGAVFGIWQPGTHAGWEVEGAPGSVCWVEVMARNFAAARLFYEKVFGWRGSKFDTPSGQDLPEYWTFALDDGGESFAGGMEMPAEVPAEVPSYWQPYIAVTDCDATTARATELGATVMMEPFEAANIGRFSIMRDPLGAVFAVLQPPADRMAG